MAGTDDDFLKDIFESASKSEPESEIEDEFDIFNDNGLSSEDIDKMMDKDTEDISLDDIFSEDNKIAEDIFAEPDIGKENFQKDNVSSNDEMDELFAGISSISENMEENTDTVSDTNENSDGVSDEAKSQTEVFKDFDLDILNMEDKEGQPSEAIADGGENELFNIDELFSGEESETAGYLKSEDNESNNMITNEDLMNLFNDMDEGQSKDMQEELSVQESESTADAAASGTDDMFSLDDIINQFQDGEAENGAEGIEEAVPAGASDISDALLDQIPELGADKVLDEAAVSKDKEAGQKKPGFFKRIFGNVPEEISDEELEKRKQQVYAAADAKEKAELEKAERAAAAKEKKAADKKAAEEEKKIKKAEAEKAKAEKKKAAEEKKAAKKDAKLKKQLEIAEQIQEIENNEGRINKIGATIIFAMFIALGVFLIVATNIYTYSISVKLAEEEFKIKQYNEAYEEISGLDIKEEDLDLYYKIMNVMYVNKQLNSYNNYYSLGMYSEALDSLLKGLKRYDQYYTVATIYGIVDDFDYVRDKILYELNSVFGISESEAEAILNTTDQVQYSMKVYEYSKNMMSDN